MNSRDARMNRERLEEEWAIFAEKEKKLKSKIRQLRKELKAAKVPPKTVSKARVAQAVIHGLDFNCWDKAACCGAKKEGWLHLTFDYLECQGVKLSKL